MKKNQRLSLNKWSKLDQPWWLTIQSLWGRGQLRKIMISCIIQWESNEKNEDWTSSRGGATMQTSPCRVFRIPILCFLKCDIPNRVHGGCLRDVNTSNSVCTQNTTASSDKHGNIWCDSLLSGKWLKKARNINGSYDKMSIWNENNRFILNTGWIAHPLHQLTPITGHM